MTTPHDRRYLLVNKNTVSPRPRLTPNFECAREFYGFAAVTMTTSEYEGVDDPLAASLYPISTTIGAPDMLFPLARYRAQSAGTWERNCALKPFAILRAMETYGLPLLWLDADAEAAPTAAAHKVLAGLADHRALGCTAIAAFSPGIQPKHKASFPLINSELCSGTLWFGDSGIAKNLLIQWALAAAANPERLDQDVLWDVAKGLVTCLPPGLCCIPDLMPGVEGIVVHKQASRTRRQA